MKLLENDVKQRQVKVGSLFQKRTGELTLLRGDEVVKSWLRTLEILESRWEEDLAKKRRKKFAAWMSGRAKRRRRPLSVGAIKNLRELVKENQQYNEQCGEDAVAVNEVNQDNELDKTKNEYSEGQVRVTDGARNKFVSKNVVNLSDIELNGGEISLLAKGLKFCPTPKELDRSAIKRDFKEFERKTKCKYYFLLNLCEQREQNFRQFREKSDWMPNIKDPAVELYFKKLEEKINLIKEGGKNYSNLSDEEQQALRSLKNRRDIVIKEADKGGAIVVWGWEDYCKEAY